MLSSGLLFCFNEKVLVTIVHLLLENLPRILSVEAFKEKEMKVGSENGGEWEKTGKGKGRGEKEETGCG